MVDAALLWALVLLPAVVGAGLALLGPRADRVAAPLSVVVAGLVLGLAAAVWVLRPAVQVPFMLGGFGLAVDGLAGVVLLTVAAVSLLVLRFAAASIGDAPARFHGLMLLFVAAVSVTVTATTLPTLLLAWEVMGATSYALIGFAWQQPGKAEAGAVAFLTTRAGDLGLYVAAGAALAAGHGLALADLPAAPPGWRTVIAAGIAAAAAGKAAQLPFSFWLSHAMEGPSPVSALLHSAAMVAMGAYVLLRVQDLLSVTPAVAASLAWVGASTALLLGLVAVASRDLKQLLAASTAAQLGFVVLAAGVGGLTAGTTQLVAHAAVKALLFLTAGAWLAALGSKQLPALRGVARRWRGVGVAATVGVLALAGVAPLSLWATKEAVLAATQGKSTGLFAVGWLAALVSAAYAGKVLAVIWHPAPPDIEQRFDTEQPGTRRIQRGMRPPLAILAVGAAGLGVLALPPLFGWFAGRLADLYPVSASTWSLAGSAVLAALVVLATWRWRLPSPAWLRSWLGLETAVARLVVRPVDGLARGLVRFDDHVLDRAVDRLALGTRELAARAATFDDVGVDGLVAALARSVRWLGGLARRPQTGQVYQYYLQSAAVLAAVVVLLVLVR